MHPVTFEIVRLRQDELRREADRHRAVAAVRSSRTRHRLSPAALLSAIVTRYWSAAARRTLPSPGGTFDRDADDDVRDLGHDLQLDHLEDSE